MGPVFKAGETFYMTYSVVETPGTKDDRRRRTQDASQPYDEFTDNTVTRPYHRIPLSNNAVQQGNDVYITSDFGEYVAGDLIPNPFTDPETGQAYSMAMRVFFKEATDDGGSSSDSDDLSGGAVAGITIGALAGCALIGGAAFSAGKSATPASGDLATPLYKGMGGSGEPAV